jgi:cytochrome P450
MIYQTVAALMTFFVAMLLYPDIQKKAHNELDSVIGRERLPTFEDRPRLPFIDAVCKETLRWRPITPLGLFSTIPCSRFLTVIAYTYGTSSLAGVPHASTKDDVYAGFFIPKGEPCRLNKSAWFFPRDFPGAFVIGNAW